MSANNSILYNSVNIINTLAPYNVIDYDGIQYTTCRDFSHICRYKGLRQVVHDPNRDDRFIALENPNPFQSNLTCSYHEVKHDEENRLDIIAYNELGSATYAWVIAYFNRIEDGYSCYEGQQLLIPNNITSLFNTGEMLATVSAYTLNLGQE